MPSVHIVEDDSEISDLLSAYLSNRGFACRVSPSSESAKEHAPADFDVYVVDVMLPGEDGLSFCRWLRETSEVPVIILSAVRGDNERIIGLELGADDYLEKPFNPRELLARMNALLRRTQVQRGRKAPTGQIRFSGWCLDCTRQKLHSPAGMLVPLSSTEYRLITALVGALPDPVSREVIGREIFGVDLGPEDRRVDILVSRLRKKLSAADEDADFIKTVRNRGYQFCAPISS